MNPVITLFKFLHEKGVRASFDPDPKCVEDIFYLGPNRYMAPDKEGIFNAYDRKSISTRLSWLMPKGMKKIECLQWLESAWKIIETEQAVDFAGFTAGYAVGFHRIGSFRMLVTRTNTPILPEAGECPFVRSFLTQLFGQEDSPQFQSLCGWLKIFCTDMLAAQQGDPHQSWRVGQAAALIGPAGAGKTLFGTVLQKLLGTGVGRPFDYATGRTQFNEELFESALLWIDDESTRDRKERAELAARLKQFVAASDIRRHAKFMKPISQQGRFRLLWCVNDNPDALGALPKMEDGVADKIMLFQVSKFEPPMDLSEEAGRREFWRLIDAELPAFCHFLVNVFVIPKELHDGRYGVRTFHHPAVLEGLDNLEYENRLLELIDVAFEKEWLELKVVKPKPCGASAKCWEGHALALQNEIAKVTQSHEQRLLFPYGASCGRLLSKLAEVHPERVARGLKTHGNLKWIVWPAEK